MPYPVACGNLPFLTGKPGSDVRQWGAHIKLCPVTGRSVSGNWKRPLPDLCMYRPGCWWEKLTKITKGLSTVHLVGVVIVWLYVEVRMYWIQQAVALLWRNRCCTLHYINGASCFSFVALLLLTLILKTACCAAFCHTVNLCHLCGSQRCEPLSFTLREERGLRVFEKRVLREIFGCGRDDRSLEKTT
jgi:hypothetical protein